jgi:hypothetical protein
VERGSVVGWSGGGGGEKAGGDGRSEVHRVAWAVAAWRQHGKSALAPFAPRRLTDRISFTFTFRNTQSCAFGIQNTHAPRNPDELNSGK